MEPAPYTAVSLSRILGGRVSQGAAAVGKPEMPPTDMQAHLQRVQEVDLLLRKAFSQLEALNGRLYGEAQDIAEPPHAEPQLCGISHELAAAISSLERATEGLGEIADRLGRLA